MICSNCNTENNANSKFCAKCGSTLITQNTNYTQTINDNISSNIEVSNYNEINSNYINKNQKNKKKNSKKIFLVILVISLIFLIVGFYCFKRDNGINQTANLNSIFDPNRPIVIKKDQMYGYITSEGKMMIEPKYKSASSFNGNYAVVTIDSPEAITPEKFIYQIIDKKGNVMNTSKSYLEPKYYQEFDVWIINDILYDSNLKQISANGIEVSYISDGYFEYTDEEKGESGIINYKGKTIFTCKSPNIYVDISENVNSKDDLFALVSQSDEQEFIISLKTGKIIYTIEDTENYHLYADDDNIFTESNNDYEVEKYLFFSDGKLAYQTSDELYDFEIYDYYNKILELDYGDGFESLGKSHRLYYYDAKNQQLLTEPPSQAKSNYELNIDLIELTYGYKKFSSSGKYGLMADNKVVVPCEYSDIDFLNSNLFNYMKSKQQELIFLEKDQTTLLMNLKNQKIITTFNSTYVYDHKDSTFLEAEIYDNYSIESYYIYNLLSGKSISLNKNDIYSIYSNYITITKDNQKIYYNTELEQIYVEDE